MGDIPEDVYTNFKKIYLYYGKEFPVLYKIMDEIKSFNDWWKYNEASLGYWWGLNKKYNISSYYIHGGVNIFTDEFIKLLESEVEDCIE